MVRNDSELQKSHAKFNVDMTQCGGRGKDCEINYQFSVSVCVKVACVKV